MEEGHSVSMFLAGDAVQLLRDAVLDSLAGLGTGSLREHYNGPGCGPSEVLSVWHVVEGKGRLRVRLGRQAGGVRDAEGIAQAFIRR